VETNTLIVHGKSKAGHIRDLIIQTNSNVYSDCPYVLRMLVSPAQLHRACFEFELVEEGYAKDQSISSDRYVEFSC
jgi:hypothetical protein